MLVGEMIEMVQQHFPNKGETEIIKTLNRWLRDFAFHTQILYGSDSTLATLASTESYNIPATMYRIEDVKVGDVYAIRLIGNYVIGEFSKNTGNIFWQTDGDTIKIVKDSSTFSYADAGDTIKLRGYKYDAALTTIASEPTIPEEFHEALVFAVISSLYLIPPTLNGDLAKIFRDEYNRVLRSGKVYARSHRHVSGGTAPGYF